MIPRFLRLFSFVRELEEAQAAHEARMSESFRAMSLVQAGADDTRGECARLKGELADIERNLELMTEARQQGERLNEFLRGQIEAQREQHAQEIDSLKRMIDFLSPSVGGRTVFGLAPERKAEAAEKIEPMGAQNRRTLSRTALDAFYREAEQRGMHPNPNAEPPADFSQKPQ